MKRSFIALGTILEGSPSPLRGMAFMSLSALMLTGVNALIRDMSSDIHPFELAFFCNLFGILVLWPVFLRRGLHALRGLIHASSSLMFFYALSITPLARATALKFSAPLFGAVLALMVFLSPLTLVAALPYWQAPTLEQLLWLAFMGAMGSIGQMSLAQAFKEADATAVFPVDFTKLPWAAVMGYFLFGEIPDVWTWLGGAMIFSAAAYIAYRENTLRTAREDPPQSRDAAP